MAKVAVIAGYGIGISAAVAKRFGAEGFKLALVARTQSRLDAAAAELAKEGISAKGFATDLSDATAVKATVAAVHQDLGPISVLFWNPYGETASLLTATPQQLVGGFNVSVTGLVVAVQAAHEDLKANKGAVLVTGGGLSLENDAVVQMAVEWGAASLAVAKAAQRKLVHLLAKSLEKDGIYAGEVTVMGVVKGTPWDPEGKSQLTPESIADAFWGLYTKHDNTTWHVQQA